MAVSTTTVSLASADGWTLLADGSTNVLVAPRSGDGVEVYAGTSEPADTVAGVPLTSAGVSLGSLTTGDKVYAKVVTFGLTEKATVIVTKN